MRILNEIFSKSACKWLFTVAHATSAILAGGKNDSVVALQFKPADVVDAALAWVGVIAETMRAVGGTFGEGPTILTRHQAPRKRLATRSVSGSAALAVRHGSSGARKWARHLCGQ